MYLTPPYHTNGPENIRVCRDSIDTLDYYLYTDPCSYILITAQCRQDGNSVVVCGISAQMQIRRQDKEGNDHGRVWSAFGYQHILGMQHFPPEINVLHSQIHTFRNFQQDKIFLPTLLSKKVPGTCTCYQAFHMKYLYHNNGSVCAQCVHGTLRSLFLAGI